MTLIGCLTSIVAFRSPPPLTNGFLRAALPRFFAAVLNSLLPLTTSAFSGAVTSNKSAPTRFAAGKKFTQKWNCSSPNNLCKCTESPSTLATNTSIEWNLYLSWSNHFVLIFRLERIVGGFTEHQKEGEWYRKIQRVFLPLMSPNSIWILLTEFLSNGLN